MVEAAAYMTNEAISMIIRPDYHILVQSHFIRIRDTYTARMVYTSGLRSDEWDTHLNTGNILV